MYSWYVFPYLRAKPIVASQARNQLCVISITRVKQQEVNPLSAYLRFSNLLKNKKPLDTVKTASVYEYS